MLCVLCALSLFACNTTPDNGGGEGNENEGGENNGGENKDPADLIDWDSLPLDGLALISNNIARFQIVYTNEMGSAGIREAEALVTKLTELGVKVRPAVSDKDAKDVRDCEIIIGTGARNRGDEVNVDRRYLGEDGILIKIVGTRIVIAGGNAKMQKQAVKHYVEEEMGINDKKTKELPELAVNPEFFMEMLTEYYFESIKIDGTDIREYTLIEDFDSVSYSLAKISAFREDLYDQSGIWLNLGSTELIDTYEKKIIIRYNPAMEEKAGFASYIEDGDWIIECAYANAFDDAYEELLDKLIFDEVKKNVNIPATLYFTKKVSEVTYEQFGAVGDGVVDDYDALYRTHVYANQSGQKVLGKEGAVYYVKLLPKTIPVKTDVDLGGATIVVNDKGSDAYKTRRISLFTFERDNPGVILNEEQIDEIAGTDVVVDYGDTAMPWLAPYIAEKSIVMLTNKYHKDVIRYGVNQSNGEDRKDVFIMYPDGSIDPETEVCFYFDEISQIEIYSVNDTPVTIENGKFINQCCEVVPETQYMNKYHDYARGLKIHRSNVTIKNIVHEMEDEPEIDTSVAATWGKCQESYPYYAFIYTDKTYNLLVTDCTITGHTTYYEVKPKTSSSVADPDPVAQGTYDLAIERSINVKFYNVVQSAPTGLGDSRYWGIMTSNWSKDMTFEKCDINRFDAHRTFWGARLIDCNIGHSINLVGGGDLYMENVTKMVSATYISVRGDYGGTFRGNITMVDCTLAGVKSYNSVNGGVYNPSDKYNSGTIINVGFQRQNGWSTEDQVGYWDWDFGYECYMPINVVMDNFTDGTTEGAVIFPAFCNEVFTTIRSPLHKTESVTFRNMKPMPVCAGIEEDATLAEMRGIKVINEGYKDEEK